MSPERVSMRLMWQGASYRELRRRRLSMISFSRRRIFLTSYAAADAVDNIFSLVRHHNVRLVLLRRLLWRDSVHKSLLESCPDNVHGFDDNERDVVHNQNPVFGLKTSTSGKNVVTWFRSVPRA